MLRASAAHVLHAVGNAPRGQPPKALERQRRARAIAIQTLASQVIARFDAHPACKLKPSRSTANTDHYLEGRFPGGQRFLIHTAGEADIRFLVNLTERVAPGSSLRLVVAEPSCVEKSTYDSAGRDIFQDTGPDGMVTIPLHVRKPGDHLVEINADAYCPYQLKYD